MKIIKRDGRIVEYNRQKIENAIMHANNDVIEINRVNKKQIDNIIKHIEELNKKRMLVEDIQDMIETELMKLKKYDLAKAYIIYRYKRALVRKSNITDESILSLIKNNNLENDNKNSNNTIAIQRDLIASEVSKDLTKRVLLPEKIIEAHNNGVLFFHDMEYFLQPIINSCSINLEKVFSNKVIINNNILEEPSDFLSACNILAQIIANVSLSQIGEQSINIKHLSKYLKLSDGNIEKQLNKEKRIKEQLLQKEISNGIKTILYQINTLTLIRKKSPVISLFLSFEDDEYIDYTKMIIKEIFKQYKTFDNNNLKLIYVLNENNLLDKQDNLNEEFINILNNKKPLTFISSKIMIEKYDNNIFSPIGYCQIAPLIKEKNKYILEGRFNQGIVSINLPQIGLECDNENSFWNLLEERLDLCFEALMYRYHSLLGVSSNISPIHWQNGVIANLSSNEKIDSLLKNNYSTLSLGYVGLNEITKIIKKVDLSNNEGQRFAIKLLKYIKGKCDNLKKETNLAFGLYAINSEEISKYFINIDKEKYGIIKNINLDTIKKIEIENQFQDFNSNGGINIIETNLENINEIIEYAYNNILCCEIKKG